MKEKQPSQILFITGGTLTILGAFAQIFDIKFAPYVFLIGVGLIIFLQAKNTLVNRKTEMYQKRLSSLGLLSSLMLGVAAYLMITGSNSWVVMVLIYGLSSFYLSFRGNSK